MHVDRLGTGTAPPIDGDPVAGGNISKRPDRFHIPPTITSRLDITVDIPLILLPETPVRCENVGVAAADSTGFENRISLIQFEMNLLSFHFGYSSLRERYRIIINREIPESDIARLVSNDHCSYAAFRCRGRNDDSCAVTINSPVLQVGNDNRAGQTVFRLRQDNFVFATFDCRIQFRLQHILR